MKITEKTKFTNRRREKEDKYQTAGDDEDRDAKDEEMLQSANGSYTAVQPLRHCVTAPELRQVEHTRNNKQKKGGWRASSQCVTGGCFGEQHSRSFCLT
jgi:hypothetical protein